MLDRADFALRNPGPLPSPPQPMQDDFGTCMQATGVESVQRDGVVYRDVAGKRLMIPLSAEEAQFLQKKHGQ